jgi:GDPmannose 4,6-dehydratase
MSALYPPKNGKRALVTGITGQDGSYLAELLVGKGYEVYGMVRQTSLPNTGRIDPTLRNQQGQDTRLRLVVGDLGDAASLDELVAEIRPDEIYNLGAQSNVRASFDIPSETMDITGQGCVRLLEAVRKADLTCRFFQASSSEMFGKGADGPRNERTPFAPQSPYGHAKLLAHKATRRCRESQGMFAANGIMFNHESPRRSEAFVTRKITRAVARIQAGMQEGLDLGSLDSRRDWGYAADYVQAIWLMLQAPEPEDYVIASGELHSVREFCALAFELAKMPITWSAHGEAEVGVDATGLVRVRIDPQFFRPADDEHALADATRAREKLGWRPTVSFAELVRLMVEADIALVNGGR